MSGTQFSRAADSTRPSRVGRLFVFLAAIVLAQAVTAQVMPQGTVGATAAPAKGFDALKGSWVRPDGGYTIAIKSVAADGDIEAMYFNPNPLPFMKAQATLDGATVRASFALQAGGYAGSTYDLTYDPASDRLAGVYYQAVLKQRFDVYFVRRK